MKQFELVLTRRNETEVKNHFIMESDDMVEILSKLLLNIAIMQREMEIESKMGRFEDDIPF